MQFEPDQLARVSCLAKVPVRLALQRSQPRQGPQQDCRWDGCQDACPLGASLTPPLLGIRSRGTAIGPLVRAKTFRSPTCLPRRQSVTAPTFSPIRHFAPLCQRTDRSRSARRPEARATAFPSFETRSAALPLRFL